MRILLIEDNPSLAEAVGKGLKESGYAVDIENKGCEGEDVAATGVYDVILLDLMLPDRDGIQVCRNLRRRGVTAKILMLTALNTTDDKVNGLDAGADDYLAKPFEYSELLARIRALLRRGDATESRTLRCEDLELDLFTRVATRAGESVPLSNREFSLIEYFLRNQQRVLSRTQIGEKVWDMNFDHSSNVVDVYISSMRRKLDRGFSCELIHTIKGVGYRFGRMEKV